MIKRIHYLIEMFSGKIEGDFYFDDTTMGRKLFWHHSKGREIIFFTRGKYDFPKKD